MISKKNEKLLAKYASNQNVQDDNILGNSAALTGGMLGSLILADTGINNIDDLTGRTTLYHGTDVDYIDSIKEHGIKPNTEESVGATKVLKNIDQEAYKKSLNKAYLAKDKINALGYAIQNNIANKEFKKKLKDLTISEINKLHALCRNPDVLNKYVEPSLSGIVKARVPLWNIKTEENPEVAGKTLEEWKKAYQDRRAKAGLPPDFEFDINAKNIYEDLKNGSVVIEGGLGPEYIQGSSKYKYFRPKETLQWAMHSPKRFFGAAGKGLLGLGLVAQTPYSLYKLNYDN